MSAWIVSRDHLDLLLTAAVAWEITPPGEADETGRMLWKENLASVAYRYPRDRWTTRLGEQATARVAGHLEEYGPVDPKRQARGEQGWYVLVDLHGQEQVRCGDGWSVPDRSVFTRAIGLRTLAAARP